MPESRNSCGLASRQKRSDGSSSMSRCSAAEILSSSPFVLGSIAKAIAGSGKATGRTRTACPSSQSESPVCVSLSFATPPMSPAGNLGHRLDRLAEGREEGPNRSAASRVAFQYVGVALERARETRNSVSRPGVRVVDRLEDERGRAAPRVGGERLGLDPLLPVATDWDASAAGGGRSMASRSVATPVRGGRTPEAGRGRSCAPDRFAQAGFSCSS